MRRLTPLATVTLALFLSACTTTGTGIFGQNILAPNSVDVTQLPALQVVGLNVVVPESLVISEADGYKPIADIVWREDPFGDRRAQVKAIFETGIGSGVQQLEGELPVVVNIQVRRFHALTERTRYSIGGVHEIDFILSVTNQRTGEVVIPPYMVNADLRAYGGAEALEAERNGITQKLRITQQLAAVILRELTGTEPTPEG